MYRVGTEGQKRSGPGRAESRRECFQSTDDTIHERPVHHQTHEARGPYPWLPMLPVSRAAQLRRAGSGRRVQGQLLDEIFS